MLDAAKANAKTETINTAFAVIGVAGDSKMPRSKKNTEPAAWEYHVASHLCRLADARKAKAIKEAVKLGVMFDPEKRPLVQGSNALFYAGDVVEISVSVGTPQTRLDVVQFGVDLVKAGVKLATFERLLKANTHDNRAPHKFTSTIITG